MNMVITLVETKPDEPSRSMCVPPRLRRVRPTWASASESMDDRLQPCVLGVAGLVKGVPGTLVNGVPWALALALALAIGVVLLLPDPRPVGVMSPFAIELAMAAEQT